MNTLRVSGLSLFDIFALLIVSRWRPHISRTRPRIARASRAQGGTTHETCYRSRYAVRG
jgi:hypothetical protein